MPVTPLKRAKGLGPGHTGTSTWIRHHLSLILLMPLTVWALGVLLPQWGQIFLHSTQIPQDICRWISHPWTGIPYCAWSTLLLYHGMLCLKLMIEDYITPFPMRVGCLVLLRIGSWGLILLNGITCTGLWT